VTSLQIDPVKQQVAAHWGRRAPNFDEDFGHSIRTDAERAAWDRIFDIVLSGRTALDALDAGCGTGFLCFELATRGHRVTGVDFAPAMLIEARRKNARTSTEYAAIGDQLPFLGGRPREEIESLLRAHRLVNVASDPVSDLVEAQAQRMVEEGRERQTRRRYVAWGDVAG